MFTPTTSPVHLHHPNPDPKLTHIYRIHPYLEPSIPGPVLLSPWNWGIPTVVLFLRCIRSEFTLALCLKSAPAARDSPPFLLLEWIISLASLTWIIDSTQTRWQTDNHSNSQPLLHHSIPVPTIWIDLQHPPREIPSSAPSKPHREAQASTNTHRAHSISLMYLRMQ